MENEVSALQQDGTTTGQSETASQQSFSDWGEGMPTDTELLEKVQ